MPSTFSLSLSGNYKYTHANHRNWTVNVIGNGESWPRVIGSQVASSSDIYRLGIIPTYSLATPTTAASGTSSAGTYGIALVYRSSKFNDGVSGDNIQSNRSNIVDITLTTSQAAVVAKITTTDSKVDNLDIYAAQKIGSTYGAFYRVVKGCANSAGSVTFNIQISNTLPIGVNASEGTSDTAGVILATDNDYPYAQPFLLEVGGRLVSCGGLVKRVTATFTNGSSSVTTSETVYDGVEFWNLRRDSDTTGGYDGRGTYLCRYSSATGLTLVNADGSSKTYTGTTGSGTASLWTEPNRRYSKLFNPHAFPSDNVSNEYPSAILACGKVPNTSRVLLMGYDWVVAEDYDRLPLDEGLNSISDEWGCSSHFSIVAAHGKLWWLDFGRSKREILYSDGATVRRVATNKIKKILDRLTLDANGDVWRVGFIHGSYYKPNDCIRWGLYLDNSTVANYVLELDLTTMDLREGPTFYPMRYMDVFTYGELRGRNYIGQFGWTGGVARLGLDNVQNRYCDWVASSSSYAISGSLATSGQTVSTLTIASGTLDTSGDGLKGVQALVWRETDTSSNLIANPTYYHCRISANTSTTFTVNYVETMSAAGSVTDVGTELPSAPSGSGWKYAIGVIQSMIGPKWFLGQPDDTRGTFRELSVIHKGQAVGSNRIKAHGFENFDLQPREAQYLEAAQDGQQVADTTKYATSFGFPKTNPVAVMGFSLVDNNVSATDTTALEIEAIVLDYNEASQQGNR